MADERIVEDRNQMRAWMYAQDERYCWTEKTWVDFCEREEVLEQRVVVRDPWFVEDWEPGRTTQNGKPNPLRWSPLVVEKTGWGLHRGKGKEKKRKEGSAIEWWERVRAGVSASE